LYRTLIYHIIHHALLLAFSTSQQTADVTGAYVLFGCNTDHFVSSYKSHSKQYFISEKNLFRATKIVQLQLEILKTTWANAGK